MKREVGKGSRVSKAGTFLEQALDRVSEARFKPNAPYLSSFLWLVHSCCEEICTMFRFSCKKRSAVSVMTFMLVAIMLVSPVASYAEVASHLDQSIPLVTDIASLSNRTVAEGEHVIIDVSHSPAVSVLGDIVNYGTIQAISSNPDITTAVFHADNIVNHPGAIFTTVLPAGGSQLLGAVVQNLNLTLSAVHDIINHGSISSAGDLNLIAGGSIVNSLPSGVSGVAPVMQAANNLNLVSNAGNIVNSGIMQATTGNINVSSQIVHDIVINNIGGMMQALQGSINVRDAAFQQLANLSITGGDFVSRELNLYSGTGKVKVDARQLDAVVNIKACEAHTIVESGALSLGSIELTGDPAFVNNSTDPLKVGKINAGSAPVLFVARGDIIPLDESSEVTGGVVTYIAGADFESFDNAKKVTVKGASAEGGSIRLSEMSLSQSTGGDSNFIAFSGSGAESGSVFLPQQVVSSEDVLVIAEGRKTPFVVAEVPPSPTIVANDMDAAGKVTLAVSTPRSQWLGFNGMPGWAPVTFVDGALSGGGPISGQGLQEYDTGGPYTPANYNNLGAVEIAQGSSIRTNSFYIRATNIVLGSHADIETPSHYSPGVAKIDIRSQLDPYAPAQHSQVRSIHLGSGVSLRSDNIDIVGFSKLRATEEASSLTIVDTNSYSWSSLRSVEEIGSSVTLTVSGPVGISSQSLSVHGDLIALPLEAYDVYAGVLRNTTELGIGADTLLNFTGTIEADAPVKLSSNNQLNLADSAISASSIELKGVQINVSGENTLSGTTQFLYGSSVNFDDAAVAVEGSLLFFPSGWSYAQPHQQVKLTNSSISNQSGGILDLKAGSLWLADSSLSAEGIQISAPKLMISGNSEMSSSLIRFLNATSVNSTTSNVQSNLLLNGETLFGSLNVGDNIAVIGSQLYIYVGNSYGGLTIAENAVFQSTGEIYVQTANVQAPGSLVAKTIVLDSYGYSVNVGRVQADSVSVKSQDVSIGNLITADANINATQIVIGSIESFETNHEHNYGEDRRSISINGRSVTDVGSIVCPQCAVTVNGLSGSLRIGSVDTSSVLGNGGDVSLYAAADIRVSGSITTASAIADGGNIQIVVGNGLFYPGWSYTKTVEIAGSINADGVLNSGTVILGAHGSVVVAGGITSVRSAGSNMDASAGNKLLIAAPVIEIGNVDVAGAVEMKTMAPSITVGYKDEDYSEIIATVDSIAEATGFEGQPADVLVRNIRTGNISTYGRAIALSAVHSVAAASLNVGELAVAAGGNITIGNTIAKTVNLNAGSSIEGQSLTSSIDQSVVGKSIKMTEISATEAGSNISLKGADGVLVSLKIATNGGSVFVESENGDVHVGNVSTHPASESRDGGSVTMVAGKNLSFNSIATGGHLFPAVVNEETGIVSEDRSKFVYETARGGDIRLFGGVKEPGSVDGGRLVSTGRESSGNVLIAVKKYDESAKNAVRIRDGINLESPERAGNIDVIASGNIVLPSVTGGTTNLEVVVAEADIDGSWSTAVIAPKNRNGAGSITIGAVKLGTGNISIESGSDATIQSLSTYNGTIAVSARGGKLEISEDAKAGGLEANAELQGIRLQGKEIRVGGAVQAIMGSVHIESPGDVTVGGTISANGANGSDGPTDRNGRDAGRVFVKGNSVTVNGEELASTPEDKPVTGTYHGITALGGKGARARGLFAPQGDNGADGSIVVVSATKTSSVTDPVDSMVVALVDVSFANGGVSVINVESGAEVLLALDNGEWSRLDAVLNELQYMQYQQNADLDVRNLTIDSGAVVYLDVYELRSGGNQVSGAPQVTVQGEFNNSGFLNIYSSNPEKSSPIKFAAAEMNFAPGSRTEAAIGLSFEASGDLQVNNLSSTGDVLLAANDRIDASQLTSGGNVTVLLNANNQIDATEVGQRPIELLGGITVRDIRSEKSIDINAGALANVFLEGSVEGKDITISAGLDVRGSEKASLQTTDGNLVISARGVELDQIASAFNGILSISTTGDLLTRTLTSNGAESQGVFLKASGNISTGKIETDSRAVIQADRSVTVAQLKAVEATLQSGGSLYVGGQGAEITGGLLSAHAGTTLSINGIKLTGGSLVLSAPERVTVGGSIIAIKSSNLTILSKGDIELRSISIESHSSDCAIKISNTGELPFEPSGPVNLQTGNVSLEALQILFPEKIERDATSILLLSRGDLTVDGRVDIDAGQIKAGALPGQVVLAAGAQETGRGDELVASGASGQLKVAGALSLPYSDLHIAAFGSAKSEVPAAIEISGTISTSDPKSNFRSGSIFVFAPGQILLKSGENAEYAVNIVNTDMVKEGNVGSPVVEIANAQPKVAFGPKGVVTSSPDFVPWSDGRVIVEGSINAAGVEHVKILANNRLEIVGGVTTGVMSPSQTSLAGGMVRLISANEMVRLHGDIVTRGVDGNGSSGGAVSILAYGGVVSDASIDTGGSSSKSKAGNGGAISVMTDYEAVKLGGINSSGGSGTADGAAAGKAGAIEIRNTTGNVTLGAGVQARGGNVVDKSAPGAGGEIMLVATNGTVYAEEYALPSYKGSGRLNLKGVDITAEQGTTTGISAERKDGAITIVSKGGGSAGEIRMEDGAKSQSSFFLPSGASLPAESAVKYDAMEDDSADYIRSTMLGRLPVNSLAMANISANLLDAELLALATDVDGANWVEVSAVSPHGSGAVKPKKPQTREFIESTPFADGIKSIKPEAVDQTGLNNCFVLSALQAMAAANPEAIHKMITPVVKDGRTQPGKFLVQFPGGAKNPVSVNLTYYGESLEDFACVNENGSWPLILCIAYGLHMKESLDPRNTDPPPVYVLKELCSTGAADSMAELLTAQSADKLDLVSIRMRKLGAAWHLVGYKDSLFAQPKGTQAELQTKVLEFLDAKFPDSEAQNAMIMASIDGADDRGAKFGLCRNHGYAVVGYDKANGIIRLANPQMEATGKTGALFEMSVADFCQSFSALQAFDTSAAKK